jgi:GNAT superfamily N-acetyltransferase
MRLVRTDSTNKDFVSLVEKLDAYLTVVDGDEHDFYNQYNSIDDLKQVVVAYESETPVGCGAIKQFEEAAMEVKRMYVEPDHREKGIAGQILSELEAWASELGFESCVLETGKRQIEAVGFYKKSGYEVIPNYGQYKGVDNSLCFKKRLNTDPE